MTARLLKSAAWLCLVLILIVTVSPIGLRPRDMMPVNVDRALAFCLMAGLFTLAYPRHWIGIFLLTTGGALFIEALQYFSPTRHAHLADAIVKAMGAAGGVGIAKAISYFMPMRCNTGHEPHSYGEATSAETVEINEPDENFAPSVKVLWSSEREGSGERESDRS
jgi:hypothetical protein